MIIKGKYNVAHVMVDSIDDATRGQIQEFLNHPAFADRRIAIMPDCHKGIGCCIGFTMPMNDYIIPNLVGVDIGCGMYTAIYPINYNIDLPLLDAYIKANIPSGFSCNREMTCPPLLEEEVTNVCDLLGISNERALLSVGSLGGGNHFIEAGYTQAGYLAVTIHSGSRNFGHLIASYFQLKAKEGLSRYFIKDAYKGLEFLPVDTPDALDYFYCMGVAQRYASINRKEMMKRISEFLASPPIDTIESIHNYIGEDRIIRKGAISAKEGERVIIPFNMRDGIALGVGKGNADYNYSAPHGAGRIMGRMEAKAKLDLDVFLEQMKSAGVYTSTATSETLDEAPGAYKGMDMILTHIKDTVDITDIIKPIYNFKAGGE